MLLCADWCLSVARVVCRRVLLLLVLYAVADFVLVVVVCGLFVVLVCRVCSLCVVDRWLLLVGVCCLFLCSWPHDAMCFGVFVIGVVC